MTGPVSGQGVSGDAYRTGRLAQDAVRVNTVLQSDVATAHSPESKQGANEKAGPRAREPRHTRDSDVALAAVAAAFVTAVSTLQRLGPRTSSPVFKVRTSLSPMGLHGPRLRENVWRTDGCL